MDINIVKSSNIIDANRQSSSSSSRLTLLTPSKGCTMLLYFPKDSQQTARYDSRDDGSDLDSGIRWLDLLLYIIIIFISYYLAII